ncbi:cytochrome P450 [Xylogone sp. PMI_703]|nr:cytochrome P450 [Xylogone sp. PMI_703]
MNSTNILATPDGQPLIVLGVPMPVYVHPLVQSHFTVGALFTLLLWLRVIYLPLSIPALAFASYYEWTLYTEGGSCTAGYTAFVLAGTWVATFVYRFISRRILLHRLPGFPHSMLLGHIPILAEVASKIPIDAHNQVTMNHLAETYNLNKYGLFYVDLYPLQFETLLVVFGADVTTQVAQSTSTYFKKHSILTRDFGRSIGLRGLVSLEGNEWKELRTMFNAGFSQTNLFSMVPMMVEESKKFAERLSKLAQEGGFIPSMESLAAAVTVDIIGHALLGVDFRAQTDSPHPVVTNIIQGARQTRSMADLSPERLNPWRIAKYRYYDWASNLAITKILNKKYEELKNNPTKASESHAIFDLAMAKHMKRGGKISEATRDFLELLRDNVKTFIFAGHDTTSSTLSYAFFELSRNPEVLQKLRTEHDTVLGTDPRDAAHRLTENPRLANDLVYTTAVVKETLRLYLPASSVREAPPGTMLRGSDGKLYPTDNCLIWLGNSLMMHDRTHYPEPYKFIPERWLPSSPFSQVEKNAFRPFEKGSRDCIGQELAMLESRVVLAIIMRNFDFGDAYEELDRRSRRQPQKVGKELKNYGGRAYQILSSTAKPKDGLPMWVKERNLE